MKYQYVPLNDQYVFQDFLKDLFNSTNSTKSFEVYRESGYAQFGIDVYSPVLTIGIQAKKRSIHKTEKKIVSELLTSLRSSVESLKGFGHKVTHFYFATTTKKFAELQDEAFRLSSDNLLVTFYSWEDIQSEISKHSVLRKKYYPHLLEKQVPRELVLVPIPDLKQIIGRGDELEHLDNLLNTHNVIAINSIGGIGKTTLAKLFYQKSKAAYDHLIWIDYLSDIKNDIALNFKLIKSLGLEFSDGSSTAERYEAIIKELTLLSGNVLIFIDNIQHENKISIEQELRKLSSQSHIKIIITTRHQFASIPSLQLQPLSIENAITLFHSHCLKTFNDTNLSKFLDLLEYNTLLIELFAKTLNNSVGLKIDDLIELLSQNDLQSQRLAVEIEHYSNNDYAYDKLYAQLMKAFDFTNLNDGETYTLHLLSVLPSIYIPIRDLLEVFLRNEGQDHLIINAVNSLAKKGLITRLDDSVKVHRLVQDIVRIQSEFTLYVFILNPFIHLLNETNSTHSNQGYKLLTYGESIITKLKGPKTSSIKQPLIILKNNLFIMYRYLGDFIKAEIVIKEIIDEIDVIENMSFKDKVFLATIHHSIATYYRDQQEIEKCEHHLKKAVEINDGSVSPQAVQYYNGLFLLNYEKGNYSEAGEYCVMALEVATKLDSNDNDYIMAMVLNNIAMFHQRLGDLNKAVYFSTEAIKTHRASKSKFKSQANLAAFYSNAAIIFSQIGNHEMAEIFILHAIEYRHNLELSKDMVLVEYHSLASQVYYNAGDFEKSKLMAKLANDLNEAFLK